MDFAKTLGILAGIIHIIAFILYNRDTLKHRNRPNATTWFLWAILATVNCLTYSIMSGDFFKAFISVVSSVANFTTFLIALVKGRFKKLGKLDYTVAFIVIISLIVWWIFGSAMYANLVLQICFTIAFVPTYRGIAKNSANEKALPWFVWALAYSITTSVVIMRWSGQIEDLAYPGLAILGHAGVGLLALRKTKNPAEKEINNG